MSPTFLDGIARIWRDDRVAIAIALVLGLLQFAASLYVWSRTWRPLASEAKRIRDFASKQPSDRAKSISSLPRDGDSRLRRAWEDAFRAGEADADSLSPSEAFEASRLLPRSYNGRLDASAPGLFTALGIVGTFIGLILGFLRVNPSDAGAGIGPLLGGMVVAFGNSLIGVTISVAWSLRSRVWRHRFDVACDKLVAAISTVTLQRQGVSERLLQLLTIQLQEQKTTALQLDGRLLELNANISYLRSSSEESSRLLLENLSTKMGDSFRSLVNMPFEQLNASVIRFDEVVRQTAERHEEIRSRLEAAATHMTDAETRMSGAVEAAKQCVEEFALSALQLREGAGAAEDIVNKTRHAAEDLGRAASEVQRASNRYEELGANLVSVSDSVTGAVESFHATTNRFETASGNLEAAVASIVAASDDTVEKSVSAVRRELEESIRLLVSSVSDVGKETIASYADSSARVVDTVDRKMSDLTDRLSAELTTLASRLPAEVESLNEAMKQIRAQIQQATRSMDGAVKTLAQRTPEAMQAQLDAYDKALSRAMDHFSGTLQQWDGKVATIESLAVELRRLSSHENRSGILPLAVNQ